MSLETGVIINIYTHKTFYKNNDPGEIASLSEGGEKGRPDAKLI